MPAEVQDQLPSWQLMEISATGAMIGRVIDGLYEDLHELAGAEEGGDR